MEKPKPTKRVGMVLLTMCLLWLMACTRDQLQPPTPSILNTYRGTDKMVLQVIETLKEPANKVLLAELEKQGRINWEYKVFITSRFLQGYTLRFATGANGSYLDAEVDAETKAIKLYSNQMQQQRDAMAEQAFSKRSGANNSTQSGVCTYGVSFDIELIDKRSGFNIAFFDILLVPEFWRRIQQKGFVYTPNSKIFTFVSNKNMAYVDELLQVTLKSVFHPEGPWAAIFMNLSITNSCGDDGPPLTQTIPPITWRPASPVISYQAGISEVKMQPFLLSVTPFKDNGFWKLKIQSLTGGVSMFIFTGGYRDPYFDPPITAGQANDAINYMSAYFSRGSSQGWHTTDATLAHENYHYTEIKAIGNHYWQQAAACINGIKVPASGNDAADKALAEKMASRVAEVDLWNACNTYLKTLGDGAGDRPYAAGQLELNKTITWIKQRADASGW